MLAQHFNRVVASDISREALRRAAGNCGPGNLKLWYCTTVDDGARNVNGLVNYIDVGVGVSLAVNPAGLATIAYTDWTDTDLLVARQQFFTFLPLVER